MNDYVSVQLTDLGRAIYRHWHEEQNLRAEGLLGPCKAIEEDESGWSKWQLWRLMGIFGSSCKLGGDLAFQTTIEIDGARI